MVDNVTDIGLVNKVDVPADKALKSCLGKLKNGVVVMGYTEDGGEYYVTTISNPARALWLAERFKLLSLADEVIS